MPVAKTVSPADDTVGPAVLDIRDVAVSFGRRGHRHEVVHGVSARLDRAQVTVLLGESGCGKTVLSRTVTGVVPRDAGVTGRSIFGDKDLLESRPKDLRELHGNRIAFVSQDPSTALDPMRRAGGQVAETLRHHHVARSRAEAKQRTLELLATVGIQDAERVARSYPHQLSGGQRQRVAIAIAVSCGPELLIADEPSSALDASVGARVVRMLDELRYTLGTAVLFITHDIAIAAAVSSDPGDRVLVMMNGSIVESGRAKEVLTSPRHEYTRLLLAAEPSAAVARGTLAVIPQHLRRQRWGPLAEVAPGHFISDTAVPARDST